jgi:hypothetical protein
MAKVQYSHTFDFMPKTLIECEFDYKSIVYQKMMFLFFDFIFSNARVQPRCRAIAEQRQLHAVLGSGQHRQG